jgi:hypothetical protein
MTTGPRFALMLLVAACPPSFAAGRADFRDLQAAIDAAPDGGVVKIPAGVFAVEEPLVIRGKRLAIRGAGDGRRGGRMTALAGPAARPVVDDRGEVILPVGAVRGMFEIIGADVEIRDLAISGFDAGVVAREDESGMSSRTRIKRVAISRTGRGVVSLSSGPLTVKDTHIEATSWHGVSISPPAAEPIVLIDATEIVTPFCAGIYFEQADVEIKNTIVGGAICGGIAGRNSFISIHNTVLLDNRKYGIGILEVLGEISDVLIKNTKTLAQLWGDGIAVVSSPNVEVNNADVQDSARSGLAAFGSHLSLKSSSFTCQAFDIDTETYQGVAGTVDDEGGNLCGCGGPMAACLAVSSGLAPLAPVTPAP